MKKSAIFLVLVFSLIFSYTCWGGHAEGNGGETQAQEAVREFLEVTEWVVLDLNSWAKNSFPEISGGALLDYKNKTEVYATQAILRMENGDEVDAKNYPSMDGSIPKIEFTISKWVSKSILEKKALVFHEFCGIAQLEENKNQLSDYNISAHYKDSLIERDAETEKFRELLRTHMRNVGEAALSILNPDTAVAIQNVEELKKSDLYKTATNTREKKHWWQSASVPKDQQISATLELSEKLSVLAWIGDVQAKVEILQQRDQRFQEWAAMIPELPRKALATENREEFMMENFSVISEELNQIHQESLDRMYQKCYTLPLGKSIDCAFELVLYQLNHTFPQAVQERKVLLENKLQTMITKIGRYYE